MKESVWVHHDGAHGVTRPTYATVSKNCHTVSADCGCTNGGKLGRSRPIKVNQGKSTTFLKRKV